MESIAFIEAKRCIGTKGLQKLDELGNLVGDKIPLVSIRLGHLTPQVRNPSIKNYLVEMQCHSRYEKLADLFAGVDDSGNVSFALEMNKQSLRKLSKIMGSPCVEVELDLGDAELRIGFGFKGAANILDLLYDVPEKCLSLKQSRNYEYRCDKSFCDAKNNEPLTKSFLEKYAKHEFDFFCIFKVSKSELQILPKSCSADLILESMYNLEDSQKDLTIVVKNEAEIKCHRSVLIVQSPVLASMLSAEYGMKEVQTGRIEMLENSEEGVSRFVKFMYGLDIPWETITPDEAIELLQLADKYHVLGLERVMVNILSKKKMNWYSTVDNLMELYYFVRNIPSFGKLKAHALTELAQLSSKTILSSEYCQKLGTDERTSFLGILLDWNRMKE